MSRTGFSECSIKSALESSFNSTMWVRPATNCFEQKSVNRIPGARLPEGTCVTDTFGRKLCSQVNTNEDANGFVINPVGRLNPNQGFLRVWENVGNSIYHGLQLSVQKQMSHGLQISRELYLEPRD